MFDIFVPYIAATYFLLLVRCSLYYCGSLQNHVVDAKIVHVLVLQLSEKKPCLRFCHHYVVNYMLHCRCWLE